MSFASTLARFSAVAVLACACLGVNAASDEGNAERGRALYEGRVPMSASTTGGAPVPAVSSGCVKCHRHSGMGSFEGRIAIAPITGRYLFREFDPDTAKFFTSSRRDRVRPAYDADSLGRMLRSGVAPDGHVLRAPMPVYKLPDADVRDLASYLRGVSTGAAPGIDATTVRIATVTTPGADAARVDAMLQVLHTFETRYNSQTRHEVKRSAQATKNHYVLNDSKFRLWKIVHWALEGEPHTWAAQLERLYAREPVFGILSGMGVGDWSSVDDFCESRRMPCILPQIEQVPDRGAAQERFYSVYFYAGRDQDLAVAIGALQRAGVRGVELWVDGDASARQRLARQVRAAGLTTVATARADDEAVLSLLSPEAHLLRWRSRGRAPAVAWLPGARLLAKTQWLEGTAGSKQAVLVTPMRPADEAAAIMRRADAWLRAQGLQELPADVASTTLFAATVFGESFKRLDFDYTREYMLELLEHGLENMIPMSPYPRLAIGPDQRVASKGSYLGTTHDGEIQWQWQSAPHL